MLTLTIILLFIAAILGAPLFVVFGGIALACFHSEGINLSAVIIEMRRIASAPMLVAIPLFTFAGYMMAESGTPKRILRFSHAVFGWMPGGLAIISLILCAFFTAFTGASGVTIIALGGLLYPMLIKDKYPEKFSLGLMTTSGSLGLLFPPSLPVIIYGLVAKTDINQLFIAGLIPGAFIMLLVGIYVVIKAKQFNVPKDKFEAKEALLATKQAFPELLLPIIVFGGIYGGFITAAEASAITAFYVFILEVIIYRDLSIIKDLPRVIKGSMILIGGIIIILSTVLGFTNYIIDTQLPDRLLALIQIHIHNKYVFLILLNIILLIGGCLLDMFSAIMLVPLVIPIAQAFGIHPIHLGIIYLANLEIGYSTPPAGLNLFIASFRFNKSIVSLYRSSLPFLLIYLIALLFITYLPEMSLIGLKLFLR